MHETLTDPRVIERAMRTVCVQIDISANPDLQSEHEINSIPTFVFLDGGGRESRRSVGYDGVEPLLTEMERALDASTGPASGG